MKKHIRGFIIGFLIATLMFSGITAFARPILDWRKIDVAFADYKIFIDGEPFTPEDRHGMIEPFTYNGWIYAPFEHIARALGKGVRWDGDTHSFYVFERSAAVSEIELSTGNYIVDRDIVAGTYDIIWVSGSGNLVTRNANGRLGVNEIFGDRTDRQIREFKNVILESGGSIEISSALTVKFVRK